ncbi:protein kinase, partial [Streptomyces sp. NPDC048845]|uniref:serine/threonine-protein kinase n=1 Tax=Streptomyces sp. NPDC048845 TaxID=3155390 RepID=UPI003411FD22
MQELRDEDPRRIGAYRLLGRIGAGRMGPVFLARSDRGRMLAVKLVRQDLAADPEFRERFRQEVRAARRVGGRWTAPVLDAGTEAPLPWVATGYVAGPSLQELIAEHGPLPEPSVRTLAAGLAAALTDIHAAGLVHRDLKPSNVLVTIDGPRVIDFGIARALGTVTDGGPARTGALVGAPGFTAPEQVRGERVTPACDVFCLGAVLAYAATGRPPFGTADSGVHALIHRIAHEEPDLSGPAGLSGPLRELIGDCLRKDPALRPDPAQVAERVGAGLGDGRGREPWLPGGVVAQLGRRAVQLLDRENPDGPTVTHRGGAARGGPAREASGTGVPAQPQGGPARENPGPGDPAQPRGGPAMRAARAEGGAATGDVAGSGDAGSGIAGSGVTAGGVTADGVAAGGPAPTPAPGDGPGPDASAAPSLLLRRIFAVAVGPTALRRVD